MKHIKTAKTVALFTSILCLAGCQSMSMSNQEAFGTGVGVVAGGAAGAALGSGIGAVGGGAVGAVVGGAIGNAVGRASTTRDDCSESGCAFIRATRAPVGDSVYWRNGRTGNWGYYCPVRDGHTRMLGDYCRDFITSSYKDGKMLRARETACRNPRGEWYINPDY